jgi:hypothetical protein
LRDLLLLMRRWCFTSQPFIEKSIGCHPLDEVLRQSSVGPVGQLFDSCCRFLWPLTVQLGPGFELWPVSCHLLVVCVTALQHSILVHCFSWNTV